MPIWKISGNKPAKVPETRLKDEKLLEENLEDWIVEDPALLYEPLLVIGRQVLIPDTRDKLDILALDPQGNAVIVELKRGHLKDPVDVQALRYASYISKWQFEDFENQARNFLHKEGEPDFNFNARFEAFCEDSGVDDVPDLNQDQRIILVGSAVREKLGSVALWLRSHSIDMTVIEVQAFRDADSIFVQPTVIVPAQVSRFAETGRVRQEGVPWVTDGKAWHLDKRCGPKTRQLLAALDAILQARIETDGPHWNQKNYVSYRSGNSIWLAIQTAPGQLRLDFVVRKGAFDTDEIAKALGIVKFDRDEPLADKLGLPSSVLIIERNESTDRVRIRMKDDFNLEAEAFGRFLEQAYKAFPRHAAVGL